MSPPYGEPDWANPSASSTNQQVDTSFGGTSSAPAPVAAATNGTSNEGRYVGYIERAVRNAPFGIK